MGLFVMDQCEMCATALNRAEIREPAETSATEGLKGLSSQLCLVPEHVLRRDAFEILISSRMAR